MAKNERKNQSTSSKRADKFNGSRGRTSHSDGEDSDDDLPVVTKRTPKVNNRRTPGPKKNNKAEELKDLERKYNFVMEDNERIDMGELSDPDDTQPDEDQEDELGNLAEVDEKLGWSGVGEDDGLDDQDAYDILRTLSSLKVFTAPSLPKKMPTVSEEDFPTLAQLMKMEFEQACQLFPGISKKLYNEQKPKGLAIGLWYLVHSLIFSPSRRFIVEATLKRCIEDIAQYGGLITINFDFIYSEFLQLLKSLGCDLNKTLSSSTANDSRMSIDSSSFTGELDDERTIRDYKIGICCVLDSLKIIMDSSCVYNIDSTLSELIPRLVTLSLEESLMDYGPWLVAIEEFLEVCIESIKAPVYLDHIANEIKKYFLSCDEQRRLPRAVHLISRLPEHSKKGHDMRRKLIMAAVAMNMPDLVPIFENEAHPDKNLVPSQVIDSLVIQIILKSIKTHLKMSQTYQIYLHLKLINLLLTPHSCVSEEMSRNIEAELTTYHQDIMNAGSISKSKAIDLILVLRMKINGFIGNRRRNAILDDGGDLPAIEYSQESNSADDRSETENSPKSPVKLPSTETTANECGDDKMSNEKGQVRSLSSRRSSDSNNSTPVTSSVHTSQISDQVRQTRSRVQTRASSSEPSSAAAAPPAPTLKLRSSTPLRLRES